MQQAKRLSTVKGSVQGLFRTASARLSAIVQTSPLHWRLERSAQLVAATAALILALVTSGAIVVYHQISPAELTEVSPGYFKFRFSERPLGAELTSQAGEMLTHRGLVSDSDGAFLPDNNSKRLEDGPGGRFIFRRSSGEVSLRHGEEHSSETLTLTGSLYYQATAAACLLLTIIAAALAANFVATARRVEPERWSLALLAIAPAFAGLAAFLAQSSDPESPTFLSLSLSFRPTQLIAVFVAVAVMAMLPWRTRELSSYWLPPTAIVLGAAFIVPYLGLLDAWATGSYPELVGADAFHVLGALQASDSDNYMVGALQLLGLGELSGWNARRPLTTVVHAIRLLISGPDMKWFMLVGATGIALGLVLATHEVAKVTSRWAALVFVATCGAFMAQWVPTTMSETVGIAVGLFACAILISAWRFNSFIFFVLGVALLTMALSARAGPLFVAPCIVLAGAWMQPSRMNALAWFAGGTVAAIIGIAHSNYLVWVLGGPADAIQSNFSYTLYGLAVGGKRWTQIMTDHPEIFSGSSSQTLRESQIYAHALKEILADPTRIVLALLRELTKVPNFVWGYFQIGILNVWTYAGAIAAITLAYQESNRWSFLVLAVIAGIVTSSPLILADGGSRVYASAVPLGALVVAIGFDATRHFIATCALGERRAPAWSMPTVAVGRNWREPSLVAALVVVVLVIWSPWVIRWHTPLPVDTSKLTIGCDPADQPALLSTSFVDLLHVEPDLGMSSLSPSHVRRSAFLHALDAMDPMMKAAMAKLHEPYTLSYVAGLPEGGRIILSRSGQTHLDRRHDYIQACIAKIGSADPQVVGDVPIFELRRAEPPAGQASP